MAQGTYEGGEALAVAGPRRWRRGWRGKLARSRPSFCTGASGAPGPRPRRGQLRSPLSPPLYFRLEAARSRCGGPRGILVLPFVAWWQASPSPPLPPAAAGGQGPACGGAQPFPLAAACGACGKRRCASLGPAADDGRPTFPCSSWYGGGPTLASSPLWCAGGPASPPSLNGLARRRRRVLCSLPSPAAARSQSRGSLGRARPLGAAAGRRVAARDPSPLRRPVSGGRSSARSHGRSAPDRWLRFCENMWPNEKPRNWPGIVGREEIG